MTIPQRRPQVKGPLPADASSYPFSTMACANGPVDLAAYGYAEEEYFLTGMADTYEKDEAGAAVADDAPVHYVTRVLVRRPITQGSSVAWLSILNASQGYDIEDDWRRAWDYIIARGDTYVGVTAKPINVDALRNFDPDRYAELTWGGPTPGLQAEPGWNPFQTIPGSEEGLVWDILAQTAVWARSGESFPALRRVFMMGQSQSAVYANTYLTYFDALLTDERGGRLFDGYLPGAGAVLCRGLKQPKEVDAAFRPELVEPAQIDAPVIVVSTEADTHLFSGLGTDNAPFMTGDGPLRRHWHVAGVPHSDARSRVIPRDDQIVKAGRLPRSRSAEWLRSLITIPVEPIITAAMAALLRWVEDGVPAPESGYFTCEQSGNQFVCGESGLLDGGIRLGLVTHPIAELHPASLEGGVSGTMRLHDAEEVLRTYPTLETYLSACDETDDALESEGYLEPHGHALLRRVEEELWRRCVDGIAPYDYTPQAV